MTDKRIEEIKARCEAATPGPWDIILNGHNIKVERTPANIDFIAHAREDIPWLLDQLAEAQRRADAAIKDMKYYIGRVLSPKYGNYACCICKHVDNDCGMLVGCNGLNHWEWRGPQE